MWKFELYLGCVVYQLSAEHRRVQSLQHPQETENLFLRNLREKISMILNLFNLINIS